ncbi:MAG: helix-turn-helix domain-containing protein [Leptolyngbya sp. SIO3F4]|nr:helix-turn-helix domain-containing protein [Leptolyngbya sp. SIO3F4]
MLNLTYKYKLKPTKQQANQLDRSLTTKSRIRRLAWVGL